VATSDSFIRFLIGGLAFPERVTFCCHRDNHNRRIAPICQVCLAPKINKLHVLSGRNYFIKLVA
ncbi:hypothetical protein MJM28_25710, partial [Salmonella enterica subsp. enterica serovar Montevideo]|nr:hypothetical protein [Salmonella enterica subsp. enterica serovar Montevideo]